MADFAEALTALKAGKRARRKLWEGTVYIGAKGWLALRDPGAPFAPLLVMEYADDLVRPLRPFAGAQWDLLADDWEIGE